MEINLKKRMAAFLCLAIVLSLSYGWLTGSLTGLLSVENISAAKTPGNGGIKADSLDGNENGLRGGKYVAITFDDGPKAGTTDLLLNGLRERGVHATFFLIGKQVEENETLVEQMAEDGHLIGNHTFNHVNLANLSNKDAWQELNLCFGEIEDIAPQSLKVVRPPFGEINSAVKNNVDCPIILWSVDTRDWTGRSAGDIADYIVETAREGDIILLHDIFEESVRGALMAIDTMMENGYTFVTVKELFEKNGITLEPGKVYRKTYTGG